MVTIPPSISHVDVPPTMPVFEPSGVAAAAATGSASTPMVKPVQALTFPGPYNPAASLPAKIVKQILDLEFVEMSEVGVDVEPPSTPSRMPAPSRFPVSDISVWIERFSLMAAVLVSRFPDKATELFAYQASIVRAERNYEGKCWVLYDRQY